MYDSSCSVWIRPVDVDVELFSIDSFAWMEETENVPMGNRFKAPGFISWVDMLGCNTACGRRAALQLSCYRVAPEAPE